MKLGQLLSAAGIDPEQKSAALTALKDASTKDIAAQKAATDMALGIIKNTPGIARTLSTAYGFIQSALPQITNLDEANNLINAQTADAHQQMVAHGLGVLNALKQGGVNAATDFSAQHYANLASKYGSQITPPQGAQQQTTQPSASTAQPSSNQTQSVTSPKIGDTKWGKDKSGNPVMGTWNGQQWVRAGQ